MISLSQIRAARALLDWKQDDLAAASGVSLPSINNIERGLYSPRPDTYQAIVTALEKGGIVFTEDNGLRLRQAEHDVITFTGPEFIRDLDHDILATLQGPQDELLACSCDESKWMEYGSLSNPVYLDARAERQWGERILIPETATFLTSPIESYRTLPQGYIGSMAYEVYGNRLAMIEWEARRLILIKNSRIADMFRRQFNGLWNIAKPLSAKQAKALTRIKETS